MKKRVLILICILSVLLAGIPILAGSAADGDHPITLTVTCDPDPELEEGGTIPDLLFTIRNTGTKDYTLENATLSGGYENRALTLDEKITVLAGGTKEFHLTDVAISDEQLDTDVEYRLSWEERELAEDEETGGFMTITHERDTAATVNIPRFVLPELTVSVSSNSENVRAGESFTVVYTIQNDTKYDMSGLKLYDPEQSMQRIELSSTDLYAGEQRSVEITYTMGKKNMSFKPAVEYIVRQREMVTQTRQALTVESIIVDVKISVQKYPPTADGTDFAITVKNDGNRTVTDIRLYDEINTSIGEAFDLASNQSKVLEFRVPSAVSSDFIRKVHFHLHAVDCNGTTFTVTDPNQYEATPYVGNDAVKLYLYVEIPRAFYNENGKLCAEIQFEIRNYSDVTLHNAVLYEDKLFKNITGYAELQNGETYYSAEYQLDGVKELIFRVSAFDPAGNEYQTGNVRVDLSNLKALADQTKKTEYVYPNNPYFSNLIKKLKKPVKIAVIAALSVVAACMIACIALYIAERRLKAKLPPAFEDDLEKAIRKTQRRMDNPLFKDAPTEQFGYTVPIKLRDYGELTEQEAEARRSQYARKLRENLDRDAKIATDKPARSNSPVKEDKSEESQFTQTRIIPVSRKIPREDAQKPQEDAKKRVPETNRPAARQTESDLLKTSAASAEFKPTRTEPSKEPEPEIGAEPVAKPEPELEIAAEPIAKPELVNTEKTVEQPESPAAQPIKESEPEKTAEPRKVPESAEEIVTEKTEKTAESLEPARTDEPKKEIVPADTEEPAADPSREEAIEPNVPSISAEPIEAAEPIEEIIPKAPVEPVEEIISKAPVEPIEEIIPKAPVEPIEEIISVETVEPIEEIISVETVEPAEGQSHDQADGTEIVPTEEDIETMPEAALAETAEADSPAANPTVPEPALITEEQPLIRPQLPNFIAQYIRSQTIPERSEPELTVEEPEPLNEENGEPLGETVSVSTLGPCTFDAMQRPTRRVLERQTPKRMNG